MADVRSKFIIDCDGGTDDAQAILMALAQTDVDVIAVTCVFGNTYLDNVWKNVLRVLTCSNRLDIPVYKGCSKSMIGTPSPNNGYHGNDGLGDVTLPDIDPVDTNQLQTEHAANALVMLVSENPGDITLVTLGPLTNIAVALQLDETFGQKVKALYTMGGAIEAKGHVTPCAEFNIHCDPEAAYFVFHQFGKPINLICQEFCDWHSLSWAWYDDFVSTNTAKAKFVRHVEEKMTQRERIRGIEKYIMMWDQLAMAIAIDPSFIQESKYVFLSLELHGELSRGQTIVDWKNRYQKPANARLILKTDIENFKKIVQSGVK